MCNFCMGRVMLIMYAVDTGYDTRSGSPLQVWQSQTVKIDHLFCNYNSKRCLSLTRLTYATKELLLLLTFGQYISHTRLMAIFSITAETASIHLVLLASTVCSTPSVPFVM